MDSTHVAAKGTIFAHVTPGAKGNSMSGVEDAVTETVAQVRALGVATLSEPDLFAIVNTVRKPWEPMTTHLWTVAHRAVTRAGVNIPDTYGRGTVSARVFAACARY